MALQFVTVGSVDDFPAGSREVFDLDNGSVILFNVDGTFYAVENMCSHDEYELHDGALDGCSLECPKHGAYFDITTGEAKSAPAYTPIKTFRTRVEGNDVQIELDIP